MFTDISPFSIMNPAFLYGPVSEEQYLHMNVAEIAPDSFSMLRNPQKYQHFNSFITRFSMTHLYSGNQDS